MLAFVCEWFAFLLVHGVSVLSLVNGLKSFILAMGMYLIVLMLGVSSAMGVSWVFLLIILKQRCLMIFDFIDDVLNLLADGSIAFLAGVLELELKLMDGLVGLEMGWDCLSLANLLNVLLYFRELALCTSIYICILYSDNPICDIKPFLDS